jgi:hypothetical protein
MNESPRAAGAFVINHDFPKPNHLMTNFMWIIGEQHAHILERIQAKYVFPIHYPFTFPVPDYDLMESYFHDAMVFRESMESWALTDPSSP